jgi:trans-2-enoyl-CoA reductase
MKEQGSARVLVVVEDAGVENATTVMVTVASKVEAATVGVVNDEEGTTTTATTTIGYAGRMDGAPSVVDGLSAGGCASALEGGCR